MASRTSTTRTRRARLTKKLCITVQDRLAGCDLCVGPDDEVVDVKDVCRTLHLRVRETNRVVRHLICPNCEAGPHEYGQVARHSPEVWRDLTTHRRWRERYARELSKFAQFLQKYPSLGAQHPLGRRIASAVARARTTTVEPKRWYRARPNTPAPLPRDAFLPPDPHAHEVGVGRFNHAGQAAFYAAASPETCCAEKLREDPGEVWIAEVSVDEPIRVLDLRVRILGRGLSGPLLLAGLGVSVPRDPADHSPSAYAITRYIADLVRKRRHVHGLVYTSSRDEPFGENLVLVKDPYPITVRADPRRYRWASKPGPFFDEGLLGRMHAQPIGEVYPEREGSLETVTEPASRWHPSADGERRA
jgi:RES domain-containing protein